MYFQNVSDFFVREFLWVYDKFIFAEVLLMDPQLKKLHPFTRLTQTGWKLRKKLTILALQHFLPQVFRHIVFL